MHRAPSGRSLWLAPLLGGLGVTLGVVGMLAAARRDNGDSGVIVLIFLLMALNASLSALLVAEQRGWRSAATRAERLEKQLATREQALSEAGMSDSLTGLRNRLAFYEILEHDFERAQRSGQPLTCLLIDLDYFRRVNDRYGHHFGDVILIAFAKMLTGTLRGSDVVCRFGGDEFMLLLPEANVDQSTIVAERIRHLLKREVFSDGIAATAVTASYGLASAPAPGVTRPGVLIERAEAALAVAKRGGRDRYAIDPASMAPRESPAENAERSLLPLIKRGESEDHTDA